MKLETRIKIEKRILKRAIQALIGAGYLVRVYDGEEYATPKPTNNQSALFRDAMSTDEDMLVVYKIIAPTTHTTRRIGWVEFIYGNDGYDVISDYTTNLATVMAPVNAYADSQERIYG